MTNLALEANFLLKMLMGKYGQEYCTHATLVALQVLKKRLAMNEPTVMCGNFSYEEGADLEEDEVEANQKLLAIQLNRLPGGGITNGSIVMISDQAQDFSCQMVVSHKVCF